MNNKKDILINKTMKFSLLDGIFASSMVGFTQEYFTPFLLLLNATAAQIGILNAVPNLFASMIQLKTADIAEKVKSRKKIITFFVFLQALVLLFLGIIALNKGTNIFIIILFVAFYTSFGAFVTPVWGSLMSDLVSQDRRGEYFGWRNKVMGFVMVFASISAGLLLHFFKGINVFTGFGIIFISAFIFRLISWYFLSLMYEPKIQYHKDNYFDLFDFVSQIRSSNFAKFVLFVSMMNFSVNIVAPFFAVYLLKNLQFSYILYTVITATSTLTVYISMSRWGRHADKIGNIKIIKFCSRIICIIPALWIISPDPVFLILCQIVAGFVWAGFNLCTSNFIFDAVTPAKRIRCIAYFNVFNGLFLCAGAISGGFLLQKLPPVFGNRFFTLLLFSAILRFFAALLLTSKIKEVRNVEKIKSIHLFYSIIGIRPHLGIERKTIRF
ncbi:MFS transporter [Candidatus Desantisbacteria bacterium]|nr:MFS transporter [Candidatus Desantisbacteria bacterium]